MPAFPKIREVHIRNYKSIEQAVVRLGDVTVLVGANGSGKSNFVDAITFVRDCLVDSVEGALRQRGGFPRVVWRSASAGAAVGVRLVIDLSVDEVADYAIELSEDELRMFIVVEERCVVTHANGRTDRYLVKDGIFGEEIPGIRPQIGSGRLALFAASATPEYRSVYNFLVGIRSYAIIPEKLSDFQTPDAGWQLHTDGSNAASVLRQLRDTNPDRFERVSELISSVVPGVRGVSATDVGERYQSVQFHEVGARSDALVSFSAVSMSEGTLRVLGFLLAAYQPHTPSVLVIEEPEANIHPAAAEVVTSVLVDASRRSQVLITTHSAEMLDHDDLSEDVFRVVVKDNGRTTIAPIASAAREAIREHLYSPGELLRIDELGADLDAAREMAERMDVFGPPAQRIGEAA
jgi:predicted ATPase